jgi:hypothetical protein
MAVKYDTKTSLFQLKLLGNDALTNGGLGVGLRTV